MSELSEIVERIITGKVESKAEELGVQFKVKHSVKNGIDDVLLRIKRTTPVNKVLNDEEVIKAKEEIKTHNKFTDFVTDIVIGSYANGIRFTYPTKL